MGVQFYIDAAVTGQFANLPVTTVQCAFTIFNCRAQKQDYFWGTLGYVPNYRKEISHGNQIFAESGHVDAIFCQAEDIEGGQVKGKKKPIKAQDLHEILDVVLESYIKIQDTGFYWDLCYKNKVRSMKTSNLFYLPPIYALIQMKLTNCADTTPLEPAMSTTSADIVQSQH
jgi:hypothetical protein